ncbi:MAG: STAS domain-containing protein [Rhodoferax sp.]|nr:STAS domain-containing protein [Rhodoferax sp.]
MLVLPAALTRLQASACLQMLVQGLRTETGATVLVDAAALGRFDSAALAVLLELRRESRAVGKMVAIRFMPDRLRDLASLYGVAELLPAG